MSSEHGETENGRANSVNDEEEEEEGDLSAGIQHKARTSSQAAIPALQSEPNGDPDIDEDSASGSHQLSLDGLEKHQKSIVEPNGPGLLPVRLERPSSADGSLSIPDDTPSVQVCTNVKIVVQEAAKHCIRDRCYPTKLDVSNLQSTVKVPRLHCVHSIVDSMPACPPLRARLEHRHRLSSIYTLDSHLQAIRFIT